MDKAIQIVVKQNIMKSQWRFIRLSMVALVFSFPSTPSVRAESTQEEKLEEEDKGDDNYLYNTDDASPIVEYKTDEVSSRPDFIFGPDNGPRVVEFYAPWCPHCQHFRDHYIEFGRHVDAVTEEMGTESITFYSVSCTVHKTLCRSFDIQGYPRVHLFPAGSANWTEIPYFELHPFSVIEKLGITVDRMHLEADFKQLDEKQLRQEKNMVKHSGESQRSKQEVFDDAYLSFDFNLRNGIFTSNDPLTNSTKLALRDWLELLKRSLPPAWQVQAVISAVLENFDEAASSEESLLRILDNAPLPPKRKWSTSCTKGIAGMGYTCGCVV